MTRRVYLLSNHVLLGHANNPRAHDDPRRGRRQVGGARVGRVSRHRPKVAAATTAGAA